MVKYSTEPADAKKCKCRSESGGWEAFDVAPCATVQPPNGVIRAVFAGMRCVRASAGARRPPPPASRARLTLSSILAAVSRSGEGSRLEPAHPLQGTHATHVCAGVFVEPPEHARGRAEGIFDRCRRHPLQNTREAAMNLKNMKLGAALKYLDAVIAKKDCVPFRRFNGGAFLSFQ
jgi:hypothetical protein